MPKYSIYGVVAATKYIGEYEANSKEEAEEMAWQDAHVSVCHQCANEVDGADITELVVEESKE